MIDRRIKFRHVQCFVEISQEGSFKAAAYRLNLTQPAISKTLKELEELVGHRLLDRDRGGARLTRDGEVFLHFARLSLSSLQEGLDSMSQSQTSLETLSIGALPSVTAWLIPSAMQRFREAAPQVILRITDGPHAYMLERLKLGQLDLLLGRMGDHSQMRGVAFSALYRERLSFVVRAGHPLFADPQLRNIGEWPVVYPPAGSVIRPIVDRYLIENGVVDVPRRIETVSGAFGRVYVQNSDAIWIISEGVVANEISRGVLAKLPFDTETTLGPIGIMHREDWDYSQAAKVFRRVLRETADGLNQTDTP
ncbi:MAG: pca operon transcription factor PcaQ [Pseudomonadota bacterium]